MTKHSRLFETSVRIDKIFSNTAMHCISTLCPYRLREAFPMVLVANKVDLVHLRKVTTDQGQEMAAKHNVSSLSLSMCP